MVLGDVDSYMQKKIKLDHQLTPYTKINSRWIKDLNISSNIINIIENNISRKISDIQCSNIFTDVSPRERDLKGRISKWDCIKIKSFCLAKENISKMKQATIWESIFANYTLEKGLFSKIHEELHARKTTQLKNGQRAWIDNSPRRT